jgi:hypothetical protein
MKLFTALRKAEVAEDLAPVAGRITYGSRVRILGHEGTVFDIEGDGTVVVISARNGKSFYVSDESYLEVL